MNASEVMALVRASDKPYYLYILAKPNGSPFYVGVGTGRRLLDHDFYARKITVESHKLRVIRKLHRTGEDIDYSIREWFDDRADAEKAEAALILQIRRRDLRTGPLANITAGGEGAAGLSDAGRERKSEKSRAAWSRRDKMAATAHLRTPEVRARAVSTRIGQKRPAYKPRDPSWVTPEIRAAKSARLKADPVSRRPGVAAKISAALRGQPRPSHWTKTRAAKRGAHPRARPVEIDGRTFACIQDAVDALGISWSTVYYWLKHERHGARLLPKQEHNLA